MHGRSWQLVGAVGHDAGGAQQVESGGRQPEPELAKRALERLVVAVGRLVLAVEGIADAVEEGVARDRERAREVDVAGGRAVVVEYGAAAVVAERGACTCSYTEAGCPGPRMLAFQAAAAVNGLNVEPAGNWPDTASSSSGEGEALILADRRGLPQHRGLALVRRHPDAGLVGRQGRLGQDRAGVGVDRHDRAGVGGVRAVCLGHVDAVLDRLFGDLLKAAVDGELERRSLAGAGAARYDRPTGVAAGVEHLGHLAVGAAQPAVIGQLHPSLPHRAGARQVARPVEAAVRATPW